MRLSTAVEKTLASNLPTSCEVILHASRKEKGEKESNAKKVFSLLFIMIMVSGTIITIQTLISGKEREREKRKATSLGVYLVISTPLPSCALIFSSTHAQLAATSRCAICASISGAFPSSPLTSFLTLFLPFIINQQCYEWCRVSLSAICTSFIKGQLSHLCCSLKTIPFSISSL